MICHIFPINLSVDKKKVIKCFFMQLFEKNHCSQEWSFLPTADVELIRIFTSKEHVQPRNSSCNVRFPYRHGLHLYQCFQRSLWHKIPFPTNTQIKQVMFILEIWWGVFIIKRKVFYMTYLNKWEKIKTKVLKIKNNK